MGNFFKDAPKSDLHVHLDGSLRLDTLIDLAKSGKIKLPSTTVDGLNELLFKDNYKDLGEYLTCFGYTVPVMQTRDNLERVAYEFALDNLAENVFYVEVRFAPQLHMNDEMDLEAVLVSVNNGLARAQSEFNNSAAVKNGQKPRFIYGIIACAMRSFGKFSNYYAKFLDAHPFSSKTRVAPLASYELAQGVIHIRDKLAIPIVGFDLAGQEDGFPAKNHWKAYQFVHENFMHKTVHAGEAYGAESIFQAITELHADRIGHGYYLFDKNRIIAPEILDKDIYINALTKYIAENRITIEVCLTSNMQTNPSIGKLENHQFAQMRQARLCTTFCTDNRAVSKTTVTNEIEKAVKAFKIGPAEYHYLFFDGFEHSFYPGSYIQKLEYVDSVKNYYQKVAAKYLQSPVENR